MSTRQPGHATTTPPRTAPGARRPAGGRAGRVALAGLLACASLAARAGDCTVSTTPINFGSYDPITITAPLDSTGTVRVQCSPTTILEGLFGVTVNVALSQGSSGSYAARTLRQGPASALQYNLYTNASRTTIWGNGSGGTGTMGGTMAGLFQPNFRDFPIYGRVPAGQDPNLGLHSDTITVTVTF